MSTLIWGGGSFLVSFFIHLAVWRVKLPERQTKTLLLIMFSGLGAALLLLGTYGGALAQLCGCAVPVTAGDYLHLALLNISLILSYMITYSALEADSPSLVIAMTVAAAGSGGIAEIEFNSFVNDDKLLKPRIKDLVLDKMAYLDKGRYRLTTKGRMFACLFISYRALLGREKGG
jgi:hypothetical protein